MLRPYQPRQYTATQSSDNINGIARGRFRAGKDTRKLIRQFHEMKLTSNECQMQRRYAESLVVSGSHFRPGPEALALIRPFKAPSLVRNVDLPVSTSKKCLLIRDITKHWHTRVYKLQQRYTKLRRHYRPGPEALALVRPFKTSLSVGNMDLPETTPTKCLLIREVTNPCHTRVYKLQQRDTKLPRHYRPGPEALALVRPFKTSSSDRNIDLPLTTPTKCQLIRDITKHWHTRVYTLQQRYINRRSSENKPQQARSPMKNMRFRPSRMSLSDIRPFQKSAMGSLMQLIKDFTTYSFKDLRFS